MNKKMLMQYCDLQDEIKRLEERLEKIENQETLTHDVVQNRL